MQLCLNLRWEVKGMYIVAGGKLCWCWITLLSHLPCVLLRPLNEYLIENSNAFAFLLSNLIIWHSLLLLSHICVYMPHLLLISYILVSHCFPNTLACLSLLCEFVTWNAVWYMLYFLKLIILANSTPNLKPKFKFNFCFNEIYVHTD